MNEPAKETITGEEIQEAAKFAAGDIIETLFYQRITSNKMNFSTEELKRFIEVDDEAFSKIANSHVQKGESYKPFTAMVFAALIAHRYMQRKGDAE